MLGMILSHLLGNAGEEAADQAYQDLLELEEEGWVVVNLPERLPPVPEPDPLENLLIEHPSMSVYQMRRRMSAGEEGEPGDEGDDSRQTAVTRHVSWPLAAWGAPLPCGIWPSAVQRARAERRKLSRGALHRQNLSRLRFSPAEKRYGHFKQPCQRLYNY